MAKTLTRCPVCESALHVSELTCGHCRTRVAGQFETCRFCSLPAEPLAFLETFLRCEGNLSRVEKELGLSYPTVRNRFTAMLATLGYGEGAAPPERKADNAFAFAFSTASPVNPPAPAAPPPPPDPHVAARRLEVLDALAKGEIGAEEAAAALRDL